MNTRRPEAFSALSTDGVFLRRGQGNKRGIPGDFVALSFESRVMFRNRRIVGQASEEHIEPCPNRNESASRVARRFSDIRHPGSSERTSGKEVIARGRYGQPSGGKNDPFSVGLGRVFVSRARALQLSIVGALLVGAVSAIVISRSLGQSALARESAGQGAALAAQSLQGESSQPIPAVLGASDSEENRFVDEVVEDLESLKASEEKRELEKKIEEMVAGYPIETMVPYIIEKDKIVAAFLVGIAKKESAWGKRVPVLNSHDCFNYWGYRGKRRHMGTGGHTCFNSPKDAVDTVSRRLEKLIYTEKVDTPAEMMVVWKCGYDCSAHGKADTKKWITDVDLYFHQLDEE